MDKGNKNEIRNIRIDINIFLGLIVVLGIGRYIEENIHWLTIETVAVVLALIILVLPILGHLSVLLHELGHGIYLKIAGYKIKIFKVGPIKYINNRKEPRLFFNRAGFLLIGGYVTPEVNNVLIDEESLDKFSKDYIKFILSGIIVTILIIISSSILIILNKAVLINLSIILVNWPILIDSLNNEASRYGDIYVVKLLKEKPEYHLVALQNNLILEYPLNIYLRTRMETFLNSSIKEEEYNELILGLADKLIDEYIIEEKELSAELENLKKWVFHSYEGTEENYVPVMSRIKLSHKLLLHGYIMKKERELQNHYNKLLSYFETNERLKDNDFSKVIMDTLKPLYEEGSLEDSNFKPFISDLRFLAGECENYKKKIALIANKLKENP